MIRRTKAVCGVVVAAVVVSSLVVGCPAASGEQAVVGPSGPPPMLPRVVRGGDGYLFFADDFTIACARSGRFEPAVKRLLRFAQIIKASGRDVVLSIAPNKSSVLAGKLPGSVPAGQCATKAISRQRHVLDHLEHPLHLGVRDRLAAAAGNGRQPYWREDTHWTPAGAAIYAQALAERLDPELAARVTITPGRMTRLGDLTKMLGQTTKETAESATLSAGGTVVPDPKLDQYDPYQVFYGRQGWMTTPSDGLVQGKSLLLGDSFTYYALGVVRPLFANGTFLWTGRFADAEIVAAIRDADTVVVQLVERSVFDRHPYARSAFQHKVVTALGVGK